jgi:DNA-binding NarL/FixJ family response regulator
MDGVSARILIVDDHATFRRAARELLRARGFDVIAEADSPAKALDVVERLAPDGALVDVHLGSECGIALACALTCAQPGLAVLLTSADAVEGPLACGFVLKERLASVDLERFFTRSE